MGTPLPPNEAGDDCVVCWGPGETFGDGPTPRVITAIFSGFTAGDGFNPADEQVLLAPQLLLQQLNPCAYAIQVGPILFFWRWSPTTALASVENTVVPIEYFRGDITEHCPLTIFNELPSFPSQGAIGGTFFVTWNPEDLE